MLKRSKLERKVTILCRSPRFLREVFCTERLQVVVKLNSIHLRNSETVDRHKVVLLINRKNLHQVSTKQKQRLEPKRFLTRFLSWASLTYVAFKPRHHHAPCRRWQRGEHLKAAHKYTNHPSPGSEAPASPSGCRRRHAASRSLTRPSVNSPAPRSLSGGRLWESPPAP